MERDRYVNLLQGLFFDGRFDFKTYDPLDSYHRARLQLAIQYEDRRRLLTCSHDLMQYALLLALTPGNITHESRVKMQDQALTMLKQRHNLEFPWDRQEAKQRTSEAEADALRQQWISIWGDPSDPEVAARIQKVADNLMRDSRLLQLRKKQAIRGAR